MNRTGKNPAFRVEKFSGSDALDHAEACAGKMTSARSIFTTMAWYRNLVEHSLDPEETPILYCVSNSAGPVILLPLLARKNTLGALANFYSTVFEPSANFSRCPGEIQHALDHLFQTLRTERWTSIDLSPLDTQSPLFSMLHKALVSTGWGTHGYFRFGGWYLPSQSLSGQDYLMLLPKKQRHTIRRMPRKVEEQFVREEKLYRDEEDLQAAINAYVEIYNESWREPEKYPEFMPNLIRTAAKHGWLRLLIMRLDGEPAAAQLWFIRDSKAYIYKVAYKEKFSTYSLGSIATYRMFEISLDSETVDEIDYLSGDDDYKRNWMSERREFHGIRAYNPKTFSGLLNHGVTMVKNKLKRLQKTESPKPPTSRLKAPSNR